MNLLPKSHGVNQLAEQTIALTIAGLDPSGGAGATADLQVMAAHGFAGVTAVTALTVQSKAGVRRVEAVGADLLRDTLACLGGDYRVAGVKIGMLATAENVGVVAEWLRTAGIERERVVLDPVIRSSSGAELLEAEGVGRLVRELLPVVGWVTPNVAEAGALLGRPEPVRKEIPRLARDLARVVAGRSGAEASGALNVVVTGGHLESPHDFLRTAAGEEIWIPGKWVEARGMYGSHGTGCVFSSALLCRLLLGDEPAAAVSAAKAWVVRRLEGGV